MKSPSGIPPRHRIGEVVVCGAGAVGLSCAYYLLECGHTVTVLERGGPDRDCCSLGNAGYISPSHIVPLASPGIVGKAIRWMGSPESPFYVRPRLDPAFLSWALEFWRAARPERARAVEPLLLDLNLQSRALYEEMAERTGNEFQLAREGLLMLFKTQHALDEEARVASRIRKMGVPAEVLDAKQVRALEPSLTLDVTGGVLFPLDAHLTPQRLVATLTRLVQERGGKILWNAELRRWRTDGRSVRAAVTSQGDVGGDEFVIAAGAWSPLLARTLGIRLPLQPGKGYSLTLDAPRELPRRSILLKEARVAITPMGSAMRVGGTMELGGYGLDINPPRIRGILRSLTKYLPAFRSEDFDSVPRWCGLRPCTPDGLPYIGRTARYDNLSLATGHAMMGLSMAPITGKLVAQTLSGEEPSIDVAALNPDRYP